MRPMLFLLDANALLHRSWHAIRPLTSPDGRIVNCVYGMMMSVFKLLEDYRPDAFAACWDTEAPTFRHEAYQAYKAHRKEKEQELYDQIPWVKEGFASLGIPSLALDGFEADDLLGTVATNAVKEGWDVTIVTGDRDSLQLINKHIRVMLFVKGVTETKIVTEEVLHDEYGFTPEQFIDFKAIQGDPSDNIPGVKGIGEVGAKSLLKAFGSLKNILKAAHDDSSEMKPKHRQALLDAEPGIPGLIDLVTIVKNAPIVWDLVKMELPTDEEKARVFLLEMGFVSLLKRLDVLAGKQSAGSTKQLRHEVKELSTLQTVFVRTAADIDAMRAQLERAKVLVIDILWKDEKVYPVHGYALGCVLSDGKHVFQCDRSVKDALSALLDAYKGEWYAHDTKQVSHGLVSLGLPTPLFAGDSLLEAYVLHAGERHYDIRALAQQYAGISLPTEPTRAELVMAVYACIKPLHEELQKAKLDAIIKRFELPLVPVLVKMEQAGIKVDTDYLHDLAKDLRKEQERLLGLMQDIAGKELNPLSPMQLSHVLFDQLGLPTTGIKKGKQGYSTAASELEKLRGQHEIIEYIEDYREVSKLLSTYVEVIPTLVDSKHRLHTTFQQTIAATGRLSSVDPNVQNIPIRTAMGRRVRRAFTAERGYELVSCDYSQIELRLIAALAHDEQMIEAFEKGLDIHVATASRIWHIPLDEVTKDQRRSAKAINFGIIYGQGPVGLSQTAGISFKDAKAFIAQYFEAYPGIKHFLDETKKKAKKQGYIETVFGRRRPLPELESSMPMVRATGERMAINMPVQGTAADLMKLAMIEVDRLLSTVSVNSRLLLQVHDELVLEVPKDEVKAVSHFVKKTMESIASVGVPIVVETKHGTQWEDMAG